jgi:hypothetical protein
VTVPEMIPHDDAIELLPWLVNDSLATAERDAVREHASNCVICRRELAQLEALERSIAAERAQAAVPAPDMRRINARIDAGLERGRRAAAAMRRIRAWLEDPWFVAFATQTLVVIVMASSWLLSRTPEPEFTTLTAPEVLPAGHYVRVVFDPTLDAGGLAALLDDRQLSIVAGPSERGVYTLRFADGVPAGARETITAKLAGEAGVLFAQPLVER